MFEATTGVPAANASVRTMPKLSPSSDGAQSRSASCRRAPELVVVDATERLDALRGNRIREVAQHVGPLGADDDKLGIDVLDQRGKR